MIRRDVLEAAAADGSGAASIASVMTPFDSTSNFPHVHPDHGFHLALDRIGSSGLQAIPVVSRANIRQLLGVIVLDDILRAYGVSPSVEHRNRETAGAGIDRSPTEEHD